MAGPELALQELEDSGMTTGGGPSSWTPSAMRTAEIAFLGPFAARRAARRRRQAACEAALRARACVGEPGSWQDTELAARHKLRLVSRGQPAPGGARRRNAAWHSARVLAGGFTSASQGELAWAAAGPRLGSRLRATADVFMPQAAVSGEDDAEGPPVPAAAAGGLRCTCGAMVFFSRFASSSEDAASDPIDIDECESSSCSSARAVPRPAREEAAEGVARVPDRCDAAGEGSCAAAPARVHVGLPLDPGESLLFASGGASSSDHSSSTAWPSAGVWSPSASASAFTSSRIVISDSEGDACQNEYDLSDFDF
ncbi:unnamed protein product [Prorocentrum cordatum]|uniref:Uncharacterized protein n=1 Tax=Prorocentrum cordatum TaxID=2364126 RepID=A0ABN9VXF7_9DINO|nr:unnamed protein product [Polarella glacialis]CAK0881089.1 unnamed protein product [Polarella glacialis]